MIIDTHTHVYKEEFFSEDADAVIQASLEAGMLLVNVGTNLETSRAAIDTAHRYPGKVFATVGVHPEHTYPHKYVDRDEDYPIEDFDFLKYEHLLKHDGVVGVGECGLDYFYFRQDEDILMAKELQLRVFNEHIRLAAENDKTLVAHVRPSKNSDDAYVDAIVELRKYKLKFPELRFVIHCFTGNLQIAKEFTEIGGFLGINGILTFDKTGTLAEVVKKIDIHKLVLETDAPFLTPISRRGKRNEPLFLEEVAQMIAGLREVSKEEIARISTENAKKLFKI